MRYPMALESPLFWKVKSLRSMGPEEWETLCDGCAKCCLHKLEDEGSGQLFYTNVACRLLDLETCRCKGYARRASLIPDCLVLSPKTVDAQLAWLPPSCAYRLLAEGRDLPWWHPVVSGSRSTVQSSGNSACGRAVAEDEADDLRFHLVDWP